MQQSKRPFKELAISAEFEVNSNKVIMILSLDCNLDKDLSKREDNNQLVKYRNIRLYP